MNKTNRAYDFSKMYHDWVCKCLIEDEKFEELIFFKLDIDLVIRHKEITNIKLSQINFPYVKNIKINKIRKTLKEITDANGCIDYEYVIAKPSYYQPKKISKDTYNYIKLYFGKQNELFSKSSQYYISSIAKSIGDSNFSGHILRKLGIVLKFEKENK